MNQVLLLLLSAARFFIYSDTILGDYAYIQTSLKIAKDIRLVLVNVNEIPTQLHRTVSKIKYVSKCGKYIFYVYWHWEKCVGKSQVKLI